MSVPFFRSPTFPLFSDWSKSIASGIERRQKTVDASGNRLRKGKYQEEGTSRKAICANPGEKGEKGEKKRRHGKERKLRPSRRHTRKGTKQNETSRVGGARSDGGEKHDVEREEKRGGVNSSLE